MDGERVVMEQGHNSVPQYGIGDEMRVKEPDGSVVAYRVTDVKFSALTRITYGVPAGS